MQTLQIEIELGTPTLIGSGEGFGAVIDTDIVVDDIGLPFIPAKRLKGCLRDSAWDVLKMCEQAKIEFPDNITYENFPQIPENELHPTHQALLDSTFGKIGEEFGDQGQKICQVVYPNLRIEQYEANKAWLMYLLQEKEFQPFISKDAILSAFTELRQQTAIDETGVAKAHSLRTIRVAKKGCNFCGEIHVASDDQGIIDTLALACLNLRYMGTKRNRGFGEITCRLFESQQKIDEISLIVKKLEEICNA